MILSAIVVLVVGYIVGRLLEAVVVRILEGIGLSDYTGGTALGSSGEGGGLERALGKIAAYYVYFVAILAADVLQIPILSQLLQQISAFIPVVISAIVILVLGFIVGRVIRDIIADLIGGLAVLIAGILIADFVGGLVASTDGRRLTDIFGVAVKIFIYYMTATLTLNTIGFATDVLTNLLTSSSWRCSVRSGSRSRSASVSASASELAGTSPRTSTIGPHGPAIRSPLRSPTIHYDEGDPSDRIEPWSERQQLWEASVAYRAWQHARSPNRSRRAG